MSRIPTSLRGLCDDAAIFPPGRKPLADAITDHLEHHRADYCDIVGPLVLSAAALAEAGPLVEGLAPGSVALALTVPEPAAVAAALAAVDANPAFDLRALEVPLAADQQPSAGVAIVSTVLAGRDLEVFIEVPRDQRRAEVLRLVRESGWMAKFRTGGIRAELYPGASELAAGIMAAVTAEVPFKATAGLHHAVANTDPETSFDQYGFLNLLGAVGVVLAGGDQAAVEQALLDRDATRVAERISSLDEAEAGRARHYFRSFGTCSIDEPVSEMAELGLIATLPTRSTP